MLTICLKTITNNIVTAAVGDDAPFYGPGTKCLITGNSILNARDGAIDIRHSDNTIVSNNIIENVGFKLARNGTSIGEWTINPESWGIAIRGSDGCVVSKQH